MRREAPKVATIAIGRGRGDYRHDRSGPHLRVARLTTTQAPDNQHTYPVSEPTLLRMILCSLPRWVGCSSGERCALGVTPAHATLCSIADACAVRRGRAAQVPTEQRSIPELSHSTQVLSHPTLHRLITMALKRINSEHSFPRSLLDGLGMSALSFHPLLARSAQHRSTRQDLARRTLIADSQLITLLVSFGCVLSGSPRPPPRGAARPRT